MNESNGGQQQAAAPDLAALQAQMQKLSEPVRQVFGIAIRGFMVSAPGVPPHVLTNAIAWQVGNLLASVFQTDLRNHLLIRKAMKEAFEDGIKTAPMAPPVGPAPGMQTAALKLHG